MKTHGTYPLWVLSALLAAGPARGQGTKLADPIPAAIPASGISIALETVADGMLAPTAAAVAPGRRHSLFVADQNGQIWDVDVSRNGRGAKRLFADLSARLVKLGVFRGYDERGLLGLAFHPDFEDNGRLYTFTSEPVAGKPDFSTLPPGVAPNCQSVITEWRVVDPGADTLDLDAASAREILRIDKPQFNHNGGTLMFGHDDLLYVGIGDGGAANDVGVGHAPGGNGQSLAPGNVLGKILRIDPLGRNGKNGQYGIPEDNPILGAGLDEVFAWGFRNPFRMSFDRRTRHLWVGDVGQNDIEEVDVVKAGQNYGWPIKEGTFLFNAGGFVTGNSPGAPAGLVDPVAEYDHTSPVAGVKEGSAIIGGYVYRGRRVDALRGRYVFGDYSRVFAAAQGRLFVLQDGPCNGTRKCVAELGIEGSTSLGWAILGFGEDASGEIYLLANRSGVTINTTATGAVLRIANPARP
jgi:glucose/arabinose dehydrogenase